MNTPSATALVLLSLLAVTSCSRAEPPPAADAPAAPAAARVRRASVAGQFYEGEPAALRAEVRALLDAVNEPPVTGRIVAAASPHAGYVFSGRVAAHTFKALAGTELDTVVIIGHDTPSDAVALVSTVDAFETPLGTVPVDRAFTDALLAANRGIRRDPVAASQDHTVEVTLPFFQVLGKSVRIVPVMFGRPSLEKARAFADAILKAAGDKPVFVLASTDMSHYPPYEAACRLDGATLDVVRRFDPEALFAHLQARHADVPGLATPMCAGGGLGAAMFFARARGAERVEVLKYANSGDAPPGRRNSVVGYGSVLFVAPAAPPAAGAAAHAAPAGP